MTNGKAKTAAASRGAYRLNQEKGAQDVVTPRTPLA